MCSTTRSVRFASFVLGVCLVIAGCSAGPDGREAPAPQENAVSSLPQPEPATPREPATIATNPRAAKLIEDLLLEQDGKSAGARHALAIAKRLKNEGRYEAARKKAQEARILDPRNEDARELLDELGFMLGDRGHEIAMVAKELSEAEQVRRKVQVMDLNRWYAEGKKLLDDGKPDEAVKRFQRILDHIKWFKLDREGELEDLESSIRDSMKLDDSH